MRSDGHFGFTRLELHLHLETAPADEARALELADESERKCLVAASLDLPVETLVEISAASTE
jgi:organic hydroperoxide reductase OsmC/OhrA